MTVFWDKVAKKGRLTPDLEEEFIHLYGKRGEKAVRALNQGKVLKYWDFTVVIGSMGEYVVEGDFCTCNDFIFRKGECWHMLAVRVASSTGNIREIPRWYYKFLKNDEIGKHFLSTAGE